MKKLAWVTGLTLIVAVSFLVGTWYSQRGTVKDGQVASRKVLYYVDPMHPAYKSDKPGIAPDCGMELVPVYEDGSMGGAGASASGPPGTATISVAKQQLIGVKVEATSKASVAQTLRVLGRVAVAEDRIYKVIVGVDGWIHETAGATTGTHVKKDQVLASFFSPDAFSAQVNFLSVTASGLPPGVTGIREIPGRPDLSRSGVQRYRSVLKSLGMSDAQIEEIGRAGVPTDEIRIVAPATGIVLSRNASAGQRVEKGSELFRIADLGSVWILADVFEDEAQHLRPGTTVNASVPKLGRSFSAKVSQVQPQFDGTTRTQKVRLEADNPGVALRPDMFVDLEVPVTRQAAIVVPTDAVVDTGVKTLVYVAKGDGMFEPRKVETGWRAGDRIEIVKGLMPGERIVVSGTFLIDSESRMKAAAAGVYGETSTDPICGMEVDQAKAEAAGRTASYKGQTYYFCSDDCKEKFDEQPAKYAGKVGQGTMTDAGKRLEQVEAKAVQPAGSPDAGHGHDAAAPHAGHSHPAMPPVSGASHSVTSQ